MRQTFERVLESELVRIRHLKSIDSRARSVRRALLLTNEAAHNFLLERDSIVRDLCGEYGWTHSQIARYFGLSRERIGQVVNHPGPRLDRRDTVTPRPRAEQEQGNVAAAIEQGPDDPAL